MVGSAPSQTKIPLNGAGLGIDGPLGFAQPASIAVSNAQLADRLREAGQSIRLIRYVRNVRQIQ
jgi:hypothetical protein